MKKRPHNPPSQPRHEQAKPLGSSLPSAIPAGRKWLFRLLALALVPLLALGGLELALRLAGYGHCFKLFKPAAIGNQKFLVNDDLFGLKFFPAEMTRSPSAFRMAAQKPPGAYRIFILGESAAMGDPEPAFGAGRYLEALLREKYPGQNFEIINLGITAINSHVIVPIARECARHEGDLWIIYMGNNEMVGPFGAATVFGAQAPPVAFVRLSLALQQTRVGQLMMALGRKLKGKSPDAPAWGGMQMFVENKVRPGDPRKEVVYRNFQRNLEDILRVGLGSGAHILLNTVAVNLRDSPPFASLAATNLAPADAAAYQQARTDAALAESKNNFTEAAQRLAQAAALDPQSAELQFRLGQCQSRLANVGEARQHFQSACDLDALPFRADSRISALITQTSRQFTGGNLQVFDAAAALATNPPSGVCGHESFYEHVHLNFDGNYRLARAWAGQIERLFPPAIASRAVPDWAAQEICEQRLGLTDWNRCNIIDSVIQRMYLPPLSTQPNNTQRIEALQNWIKELRPRMDAAAATRARELYLAALRQSPDDYYLHDNYAAFLTAIKDLPQATAERRRVHELMPHDFVADFQLGKLLAEQNQFAEAESLLLAAVASHPGLTEGWMNLGEVHAAAGKLDSALEEYNRAHRLRPQDPAISYHLGLVLSRLNRSPESIQNFREAIRLRPDYWEAHYTLGGELGMHEQVAEARREFEEVIRLKPGFAAAHLNLGVALLKQVQLDEAQRQFEETLRLEPGNKIAPDYLAQARAQKNRRP